MNIEVHIERLVLEGLPVNQDQRHALRAEIGEQLASVLARQPPPAPPGPESRRSEPRVSAASITYSHNQSLRELGRKIAMSISEVMLP